MSFFWSLKDRVRSLGVLAKLKVEQLHWVTLSESKQMRSGQKASRRQVRCFRDVRLSGDPRVDPGHNGQVISLPWDSSLQELAEDLGLCAAAATPTTQISSWTKKSRLGLPVKVKRWWNDSLRNVADLMKIHELHGQLASMSTIFGCHKLCYSLVDWIHHQWGTYIFSFADLLQLSSNPLSHQLICSV